MQVDTNYKGAIRLSGISTVRPTVVALDHRFADLSAEQGALAAVGAEVIDGNVLDPALLEGALAKAHGILLGARLPITRERIAAMPACRVIVRYGIGVDNVDLDAAREHQITVCNVPEYCIEEVANHAVSLMLVLHRQLLISAAHVKQGQWSLPKALNSPRLSQMTLGLLGFGRIGQEVARRMQGFGMRVLAHDPYRSAEAIRALGAEPAAMEEAIMQSDILSLHLPLTAETRHLLDDDRLGRMKPGAILVNVSRGPVIDHAALYRSLSNGHLGGAGLDVTEPEPPGPGEPLLALPNCIVTPHVAWFSTGALPDLQRQAAEEAARVLVGREPQWAVVRG